MLLMLCTWQSLSQHICGLFRIPYTLNGYSLFLYLLMYPMPSDCNVFCLFVELWVLHHGYRAIVITSDQGWFFLFET